MLFNNSRHNFKKTEINVFKLYQINFRELKKLLFVIILLLSFLVQASSDLGIGDMIELSASVNGRKTANFNKKNNNIKRVLPLGTFGKIEKKKILPSGNYGLKIAVTVGPNKDKSFWVYYNLKNPKIKLSTLKNAESKDFDKSESSTADIDLAESGQLTEKQDAIVAKEEAPSTESLIENLKSFSHLATDGTDQIYKEGCAECSTMRQEKQNISPEKISSREKLMINYLKLGGDSTALKQAFCFLDKNKESLFEAKGDPSKDHGIKLNLKNIITINDQNKDSSTNRLFVLNLETMEVESYFTGHGYGKDKKAVQDYKPENPGHFKYNPYLKAESFSNTNSSYLTPRGFFITGNRSSRTPNKEKPWPYIMTLYGVQSGINDNSYLRSIYMHPFPGTDNSKLSSTHDTAPLLTYNPQSLTKGCTNLPPMHASSIIDKIKGEGVDGGSLYYTYTPIEKEAGDNYCGDTGLMHKKSR